MILGMTYDEQHMQAAQQRTIMPRLLSTWAHVNISWLHYCFVNDLQQKSHKAF